MTVKKLCKKFNCTMGDVEFLRENGFHLKYEDINDIREGKSAYSDMKVASFKVTSIGDLIITIKIIGGNHMITLDEIIKVLPDFEPFEVFDIDNNITYSEEKADELVWHEYEVKRIYSLIDQDNKSTSFTELEVTKIC